MNPLPGREINLESYLGNAIANWIDADPAPGYVQLARQAHGILLAAVREVGPPSGRYNCHGLVFGSRRTNIPPPGQDSADLLNQILQEDQYSLIPEDNVREGDVAVWRRAQDIDHTGIVAYVQREAPRTIFVWSMWGNLGEFFHRIGLTPYNDCTVEYWRLGAS